MSDSKNTSKSQQETVTKEDPKKASNIKTDLTARIIKQNTFGGHFHNGYADGTVKKATKELRDTQRKASVGK